MNNQVTLQDEAKIIDRLGRYFPMLVRNGSEVVNDWYPFIAQFPLDVAQAAAYLATANYVTGEVLRVDGGIAM